MANLREKIVIVYMNTLVTNYDIINCEFLQVVYSWHNSACVMEKEVRHLWYVRWN